MKIKHITFKFAGYGYVRVSAIVNGTPVYFTTNDTRMTDAASDEDESNHEVAMSHVRDRLVKEFYHIHPDCRCAE